MSHNFLQKDLSEKNLKLPRKQNPVFVLSNFICLFICLSVCLSTFVLVYPIVRQNFFVICLQTSLRCVHSWYCQTRFSYSWLWSWQFTALNISPSIDIILAPLDMCAVMIHMISKLSNFSLTVRCFYGHPTSCLMLTFKLDFVMLLNVYVSFISKVSSLWLWLYMLVVTLTETVCSVLIRVFITAF